MSYITVCSWFFITRLLQGGITAYVLFCGVLTMLYRLFNRPGGNGVAALFGPNQFFSKYVKWNSTFTKASTVINKSTSVIFRLIMLTILSYNRWKKHNKLYEIIGYPCSMPASYFAVQNVKLSCKHTGSICILKFLISHVFNWIVLRVKFSLNC